MHRASDRLEEEEALSILESRMDGLGLESDVMSIATDLYLSELPLDERSKPPALAASCYTAALISGDERSQSEVATAFEVSRLAVQQRWKTMLTESGFTAPEW